MLLENISTDIIIYLVSLAASWGGVMARIKTLEKKMELHNNAVLRLAATEERSKTTEKRITSLEKEILVCNSR